jgi:hypothetical protein
MNKGNAVFWDPPTTSKWHQQEDQKVMLKWLTNNVNLPHSLP